MAINKNFVIKNGVEVNTNLLVGDSTLNKVGIATTVPGYTLHIGVGGGARGGIGATDITVTGIATIGVANSNSGALSVTGISTFEGLIDANGGLSARTAAVQDLTNGNVVLAGAGGELEDSDNSAYSLIKGPSNGSLRLTADAGANNSNTLIEFYIDGDTSTSNCKTVISGFGSLGIGTHTPRCALDLTDAGNSGINTFMTLPKVSSVVGLGTTAGAMMFNTATSKFQGFTGAAWVDLH